MRRLRATAPAPSYEDLFIRRYERLLAWALSLTDGDRGQAEDLVHDTFIQFTLGRPDLNTIDNLDGYLRVMLRNMHLSRVRRAARLRENSSALLQLSLVDQESAEVGLRAVEERTLEQARHELLRICRYACLRKETSKAGSVLILRFFHGYRPREIALVLRVSRGSVDEFLNIARSEARAFVADPSSLTFLTGGNSPAAPADDEQGAEDLVDELRRLLFSTPGTVCPDPSLLRNLYQGSSDSAPDAALLSHLVGCRGCLDEVNRLLDLPPLAARDLTTALGRERRQRGKGGRGGGPADPPPAGGAGGGFVEKYRRRLKETLEHRPKELRVSVNGFVLGSHSINSGWSRQSVTVNLDEKIGFVEVFSEEEVRLLFALVEPPPVGSVEQRERVELSGGRTIELTLSFEESRPHVDIVYHDPLFHTGPAVQLVSPDEAGETNSPPADESATPSGGVRELLRRLLRHVGGRGFWLRPGTVTAAFAVILIAALIATRLPARRVTPAELLGKSAKAEEAIAQDKDRVQHRVIDLEERRGSGGELISRRRIEVWQSAARGITARRLYDEQGRLVAGEWIGPDGARTILHHGTPPQRRSVAAPEVDYSLTPDELWTLEPSSKVYSSLVGRTDAASLEERATTYVINYHGESPISPSSPVRASLVLEHSNLRATELTLVFGQGAEAREYRFKESAFERRPAGDVPPSVFVPDKELVSAPHAHDVGTVAKTFSVEPERAELPSSASGIATAQKEVEVLGLLNGIGADLGQEVIVTRVPGGALKVEAVVSGAQRKAEILRALSPVANDPALKIQIETPEEARRRSLKEQSSGEGGQQTTVTSESVVADDTIPVQAEVRRYLLTRGVPESQIEVETGRLSNEVLMRSHRAMLHVWALKSLVSRFSPEDLRTLQPDARAKWLSLVRSHALGYEREAAPLRQELARIFNAPQIEGGTSAEGGVIADDAGLVKAVSTLIELASANHEAVRSAFTVSDGRSSYPAIMTTKFWRSMADAEKDAATIVGATQKSQSSVNANKR
jgi:RNA polymerase sigma factor (sigma-70 family)